MSDTGLRERTQELSSKAVEYQKGLTWRTVTLIVFGVFLLQPAVIYMWLVTGQFLPFQAWVVILLWVEIARHLGSPLTRQEIFLITSFGGIIGVFGGITGGVGALPFRFVLPIFNMYIGSSEFAKIFHLTEIIPWFFAPPPHVADQLYLSRWIYLNPVWYGPIAVVVVTTLLAILGNISLGYFCYAMFRREQKLEFPAATAEAQAIVTLTEREPARIRALMLSALVGMIYRGLTSTLPFFISVILAGGTPPPFEALYDFTTFLAQILPGASFAVTTNPFVYSTGFLIPVKVALAQLIGAVSYYFFGTHLITKLGLWPSEVYPETISSWTWTVVMERSQLYFYVSISLGLGLAAVVAPILFLPKRFLGAFKTLAYIGKSEHMGISPLFLLVTFIGASFGSITFVLYLVPEFMPYAVYLVIFTVLWSFFGSFMATNAAGVTVGGFDIPFQGDFMIYMSGFREKSIWFAAPPYGVGAVQSFQGAGITSAFVMADIIGVRHSEYIKAFVLVAVLGLVSSFVYVNLFWYIQPFPSGAYPATITTWPVFAQDFARRIEWVWSGYLFRYQYILGAFVVGLAIFVVSSFVFHFPAFLISFLAGTFGGFAGETAGGLVGYRGIQWSLALFVGSVFSEYIIPRFAPRRTWNTHRRLIVIGLALGNGFMMLLNASMWLIKRSTWLLPY